MTVLFVLLIFSQNLSEQRMLAVKFDSATSSRDQEMQTYFMNFPCPPLKSALSYLKYFFLIYTWLEALNFYIHVGGRLITYLQVAYVLLISKRNYPPSVI